MMDLRAPAAGTELILTSGDNNKATALEIRAIAPSTCLALKSPRRQIISNPVWLRNLWLCRRPAILVCSPPTWADLIC